MFTNINLLLDDYRNQQMTYIATKNSIYIDRPWVIVKNHEEFVEYVTTQGIPKLISYDHDLMDIDYAIPEGTSYAEKTGKDCAEWLVNFCLDIKHELPEYLVHSQNPVGKDRIKSVFENYYRAKAKGII